jgi:hypothetical protein
MSRQVLCYPAVVPEAKEIILSSRQPSFAVSAPAYDSHQRFAVLQQLALDNFTWRVPLAI